MTWLSRSAASWLSRGEVDQPGGVPCGAVDLAWGGFAAGAGVGQVVDGERAPADPGLAEYIPFVVGEQPGQVGEQDVGGAEQHRVVEGVVVVEGTGTTQVEPVLAGESAQLAGGVAQLGAAPVSTFR